MNLPKSTVLARFSTIAPDISIVCANKKSLAHHLPKKTIHKIHPRSMKSDELILLDTISKSNFKLNPYHKIT